MTESSQADRRSEGKRFRAVVVNKGTVYDETDADAIRDARAPKFRDTRYWEQVVAGHERHQGALEQIETTFHQLGWACEVVPRDAFTGPADDDDLVVTAGGDGTVLHTSHYIVNSVPLLGVNTDPERSVGYFCATDSNGLEGVLRVFEAGGLPRFKLHRLKLEVDGSEVGRPALNDVLVANVNPAATSQYLLIAGPRRERQKSSGIWISTPAGSTAGIRSAGGAVLPLRGAMLQYLVREPVMVPGSHYELLRGVRALSEGIEVISLMPNGCGYIDGPHEMVRLELGSRLRISAHHPLTLLGLDPARRER
jgi:NAD+ kinase